MWSELNVIIILVQTSKKCFYLNINKWNDAPLSNMTISTFRAKNRKENAKNKFVNCLYWLWEELMHFLLVYFILWWLTIWGACNRFACNVACLPRMKKIEEVSSWAESTEQSGPSASIRFALWMLSLNIRMFFQSWFGRSNKMGRIKIERQKSLNDIQSCKKVWINTVFAVQRVFICCLQIVNIMNICGGILWEMENNSCSGLNRLCRCMGYIGRREPRLMLSQEKYHTSA